MLIKEELEDNFFEMLINTKVFIKAKKISFMQNELQNFQIISTLFPNCETVVLSTFCFIKAQINLLKLMIQLRK